jgi:hypothetical protein
MKECFFCIYKMCKHLLLYIASLNGIPLMLAGEGVGGATSDERPETLALCILCAIERSAHPFCNALTVGVYSYSFTDLFCCCVVAVAVVFVFVDVFVVVACCC